MQTQTVTDELEPGEMMDSPTTAILTDSPALHSLKRPQLLALCKQHNLKGNGKVGAFVRRWRTRLTRLL